MKKAAGRMRTRHLAAAVVHSPMKRLSGKWSSSAGANSRYFQKARRMIGFECFTRRSAGGPVLGNSLFGDSKDANAHEKSAVGRKWPVRYCMRPKHTVIRGFRTKVDPTIVMDITERGSNKASQDGDDGDFGEDGEKLFPKPKAKQLLKAEIKDMAFGGKGIARVNTTNGRYVVFVPNTIPGQIVKARVTKARKNSAECKLLEVLEPSPDEVQIPFQQIPGAPYATLPMEVQEAFKQNLTLGLFKHLGGITEAESLFDEFISSPSKWHYRNKCEYSFSRDVFDINTRVQSVGFGLGYKHRGTFWLVENLERDSGLIDAELEAHIVQIRKFLEQTGLPAYYNKYNSGFFRNLVCRKSFVDDLLLINLVTTSEGLEKFDVSSFKELMISIFGKRLGGLLHTVNDDIGDSVSNPRNGSVELLHGSETIRERICDLDFRISINSFFQTNPRSAENLYKKAMSYVSVHGSIPSDTVIMDLFCGTGTITQLLARAYPDSNIVGVEIVEDAVKDAKINSNENGLSNIKFFAEDVNKFLFNHPEYVGKIHTVVLDPPRSGIAPKALKRVIELSSQQIIYVSCNPATQVRDAQALKEAGYVLERFSMVDQFPHTSHIETVALFVKRNSTGMEI